MAEVKKRAADDFFKPATAIVKEVILEIIDTNEFPDHLPAMQNLARAANRLRQAKRPENPTDPNFVMDDSIVPPGFYQNDVWVNGRRHLFFATQYMLDMLVKVQRWYIDATFKVVSPPFTQLYSIYAFKHKGQSVKQLPMLFILMSGQHTNDYRAVIRHVLLHRRVPSVVKLVLDFEKAVWKAAGHEMPRATLKGASFIGHRLFGEKFRTLDFKLHTPVTLVGESS